MQCLVDHPVSPYGAAAPPQRGILSGFHPVTALAATDRGTVPNFARSNVDLGRQHTGYPQAQNWGAGFGVAQLM